MIWDDLPKNWLFYLMFLLWNFRNKYDLSYYGTSPVQKKFLCTGYQSGDGNYLNELATVKVREISYIYFFVNSEVVQKYEMAEASW